MSAIPQAMLDVRLRVARSFLAGRGIEIGALDAPLPLPEAARVSYVDRFDVAGLRAHYPELADKELVAVDVIDDGETLASFAPGSLDFIVANHFLEHCENPLGTLRTHLSKVRPGGVLYYAVPDKRMSFDVERPLTDFAHLVADDLEGPEHSRAAHFREWMTHVNKVTDPDAVEAGVRALAEMRYSIHFHVWDDASFAAFLDEAPRYLGARVELEHFERNDTEIIAVLRKPED